jgi:hypothetical protein
MAMPLGAARARNVKDRSLRKSVPGLRQRRWDRLGKRSGKCHCF